MILLQKKVSINYETGVFSGFEDCNPLPNSDTVEDIEAWIKKFGKPGDQYRMINFAHRSDLQYYNLKEVVSKTLELVREP